MQAKQKYLNLFTRTFPIFFYALLILFLIAYLKGIDFRQFDQAKFSIQYLLIAGLLGLGARFWQIYIWFTLLNSLGANGLKRDKFQLIFVYAKSWLGRYIPGTAPWILGKIYFASKHGISKNKLAVSSLLEGALQITVVMTIAFLMLFFDARTDVIDRRLMFAVLAASCFCVIAIIPPVFNRIVGTAYKLIKRKVLSSEHYASTSTVLRGTFLYALGAILSGLSLFFVAKAIYPDLDYSNALFVMATGNLAGALGMLVIFAPSGIGVREGVQLTLLSLIMPTELALLVTVTTRLWSVAIDFIFFAIAKALLLINKPPSRVGF